MSVTLYGLCGAALVGIGLYGLILRTHPLHRLLAFNLLGSGVFLLFGAVADRAGAADGPGGDPVPHAMIITGIVVALAATALGVGLVVRLARETGGAEPGPPEG